MDMPLSKALGLDGFTTNFFHHCWSTVKNDVWALVYDSYHSSRVLPTLNNIFLMFIRKEYKAIEANQLYPLLLDY
jgi:hypothetical protein